MSESPAQKKGSQSRAAKARRPSEDDTSAKKQKLDAKIAGKLGHPGPNCLNTLNRLLAAAEVEEEVAEAVNVKGQMTKDLQVMMYGFGDDIAPLPETVDLVEDIVMDYVTKLLGRALDGAAGRARARPGTRGGSVIMLGPEDIMFLVRKDTRKFGRVRELLMMQEEIKKAKSIVDVSAEEMAKLVG